MDSLRSFRHDAYMVLKVLVFWFAASVPASLIVAQLLARANRVPATVRAAVPGPRGRRAA